MRNSTSYWNESLSWRIKVFGFSLKCCTFIDHSIQNADTCFSYKHINTIILSSSGQYKETAESQHVVVFSLDYLNNSHCSEDGDIRECNNMQINMVTAVLFLVPSWIQTIYMGCSQALVTAYQYVNSHFQKRLVEGITEHLPELKPLHHQHTLEVPFLVSTLRFLSCF